MDGLAAAEVNNGSSEQQHVSPRVAADATSIHSNGWGMDSSSPREFTFDRAQPISISTQEKQQPPQLLYGQLRSPCPPPKRSPLQQNFHRPEHFSYKETPVFGKAKKKTGMAELLSPVRSPPVVIRRSKSPGRTMEAEEAIRMSTYPDGEPPKPGATAPIERDDFPAPLAQAVVLPELLRRSHRKKGRRSVPASGSAADENGGEEFDDDEEADEIDISPKLKREMLAVSKQSPMVRDIITELTVAPERKLASVDPRDSSRAPSAKGRLSVPPRFSSSINSSPSRSTDRPRRSAESTARQRRATCPTDSSPALPMCSPSLDWQPVSTAYASGTRSATLPPPGTPGAFVYDPFSDDDDEDEPYSIVPRSSRPIGLRAANGGRSSPSIASSLEKKPAYASSTGDVDSVFERESLYRSSSRSDCHSCTDQTIACSRFERSSLLRCSNMSDSVALLRDLVQPKSQKKTAATVGDGVPFLNAATLDVRKRSECALLMWEEQLFEPEQPYTYDEVKLTSDKRRKGLDETKLEKYLSTIEFEAVLGMTREDFYQLPEFRRNDVKRKAHLF